MRKALYVSGPMSGYPDFNYPLFNEVAAKMRNAGWKVVNPAENYEGRTDLPRHMFLAKDVYRLITECDKMLLLPYWVKSEGSKLEVQLALDLGFMFHHWLGGEYGIWPMHRDTVNELLNKEVVYN